MSNNKSVVKRKLNSTKPIDIPKANESQRRGLSSMHHQLHDKPTSTGPSNRSGVHSTNNEHNIKVSVL